MNKPGENDIWTPSRLRTQLAAQKGLAPAPSCYVIWRATSRPNAPDLGGYELPGQPERRDEAAFEQWLLERNLAGPDRLSVSVLTIREQLDDAGLLRECVLERRRGGAEGPYYGNVAKVEFTGPAKHVRRYRASRDGRLARMPIEDDTGTPESTAADAEAFAGEDTAVHAHLGEAAVIVDRRTPTLFEDLAGLSGIIHARRPDGSLVGCGVGWHGGVAFVLEADFPRAASPLTPPPDLEAALDAAVAARDLIRLETRLDESGFRVIARERGGPALVAISLDGAAARITPYTPGQVEMANEDQRRWMTYAETYEARTVLDLWRNGDSDEIVVVTVDQDQEAWRHVIDADGIEISRHPDNEAAAAVLYRERIAASEPETSGAPPGGAGSDEDWIDALPDETVAGDSLLAKVLAWSRVAAQLRLAIAEAAAAAGDGRTVSHVVADRLAMLSEPLVALRAPFAAGSLSALIARARTGAIAGDGLAAALRDFVARLRDELALTRTVTLTNTIGPAEGEPPFGPLVELYFPAATYDIEEATRCLALRRPTAAVLHAMKVARHGIDGLACLLSAPRLTDLPWSRLIAAVRAAPGHQGELIEALERVRRSWRAPGLMPADKYTEEEAAAVLDAVAAFMRALAARLDALGEPGDG